MARETADALFVDEHAHYTITEVVSMTGIDPADLTVLVECGVLVPDDATATQWSFAAWSVDVARRARRLRDEFALDDAHAVAIVVRFEQRVRDLERQLDVLRARSGVR
jgi:chaperone modulatory protein CbpM